MAASLYSAITMTIIAKKDSVEPKKQPLDSKSKVVESCT